MRNRRMSSLAGARRFAPESPVGGKGIEMSNAPSSQGPGHNPYAERQMVRLAFVLIGSLVFALAAAILALASPPGWGSVGIVALSGILGLAAGALVGFLFGLPKTVARAAGGNGGGGGTGATPAPSGSPPSGGPPGSPSGRLLNTNTNLEELSDWLTKIIVGLGLVQLGQANKYLVMFEDAVAAVNHNGNPLTPLGATLMLCACAIIGFLWMYMEARIVLSRVFDWVEQSLNDNLTRAVALIAGAGNVSDSAMAPAADALKAAAQLKPDDAQLRSAAVKALTVSGRTGEAASMLKQASSDTVADQISKMFVALYSQPDGYKTTLTISDGLMANSSATGRADFWFYRAAALGQKHAALTAASPPDQAEIEATQEAVRAAAQSAIAIDPNYRARLLALARPAPGSLDDDLKTLAADGPLLKIIDPATAA